MARIRSGKFANLANLGDELRGAEEEIHLNGDEQGIEDARESLIAAVQSHRRSRFQLGNAIWEYKTYYKAEQEWMGAAKVIACALDRSQRTVFRLLKEYEYASQLPKMMLEAMLKQRIDPAAWKNSGMVAKLLAMPDPNSRKEAEAAVVLAYESSVAEKRMSTSKERPNYEDFAARIVTQFKNRYLSSAQAERDTEIISVFELVIATFRAEINELKQYGRPDLVPKPGTRVAA